MRFYRNTHFWIAKKRMTSVFTVNEQLDYDKLGKFVEAQQDHFIWYEETKDGIETLVILMRFRKILEKG